MADIVASATARKSFSGQLRHTGQQLIIDMGWVGALFWAATLLLFLLYFGLPMLWLFLAPSKNDPELLNMQPLSFGSFGRYLEAFNNLRVFNNGQIFLWAYNSFFYVVTSLIFSLVITVPAGYILAVARFPGRNAVLWATLITMMLPGSALVLPLFLEMNLFGLVNTPWAVILPAIFFPFGAYLTYIYYATSLPRDILDAARVDGCNEFALFRFVGLPLAKPLLGLLAFISFNNNWNNYFGPFVMLNDDRLYNLPVGIQALIAGTTALRPTFATDLPFHRAEAALSGVIMVLPVVIVFIISQRYVISGAFTGSMKG
jgi:multiple sugar transport system permease protein